MYTGVLEFYENGNFEVRWIQGRVDGNFSNDGLLGFFSRATRGVNVEGRVPSLG